MVMFCWTFSRYLQNPIVFIAILVVYPDDNSPIVEQNVRQQTGRRRISRKHQTLTQCLFKVGQRRSALLEKNKQILPFNLHDSI